MMAPAWLQVLSAALLGAPLAVLAALIIILAVGGIVGCSECIYARFRTPDVAVYRPRTQ